mmetsp:Transcript_3226/g.3826  ORF Transcript_3226/g.3826 Transcript_3226/m.3826 type:complete len:370 (-) Transcript_3226:303-1412(-)
MTAEAIARSRAELVLPFYDLYIKGQASVQFTVPFENRTEPFQAFYVNDINTVPVHLRQVEIGLLILQLLTLFHALWNKKGHLWLGFVLFGLFQECLGYLLSTHIHAQFLVQVFDFLPLKELLWYPLNLYPAWLATRQWNIVNERGEVSYWGNAAAFALLNHFNNVPYDYLGGRVAADYFYLNVYCKVANFDIFAWHGGVAAVLYGWIAMGLCAGAAAAISERKKFSSLKTILAIGFSSIVSSQLWLPYNLSKFASCDIPSEGTIVDKYFFCVKNGKATDEQIYLGALAFLLVLFVAAMGKRRGKNRENTPGILVCVIGYWLLLFWGYATRNYDFYALPAVSFMGSIAIGLHYGLHMKMLNRPVRKRKAN